MLSEKRTGTFKKGYVPTGAQAVALVAGAAISLVLVYLLCWSYCWSGEGGIQIPTDGCRKLDFQRQCQEQGKTGA